MKNREKPKLPRKKRHSRVCPCREHIKIQTQYFSPLLQKLGKSSFSEQREIIKGCDPCFIRYLGKCACGILNTNIKLNKKDYASLKDSKRLLLSFAKPDVSLKKKRALLQNQNGGAFPFLSILGGLASSLIGNLITKHNG